MIKLVSDIITLTDNRPTLSSNLYCQDKLIDSKSSLIDTGSDKTYLSHNICIQHKLTPDAESISNSIYGKDMPVHVFCDISIELIDENGNRKMLVFEYVYSIIGTEYDHTCILGMDALSKASKLYLNFQLNRFELTFRTIIPTINPYSELDVKGN